MESNIYDVCTCLVLLSTFGLAELAYHNPRKAKVLTGVGSGVLAAIQSILYCARYAERDTVSKILTCIGFGIAVYGMAFSYPKLRRSCAELFKRGGNNS